MRRVLLVLLPLTAFAFTALAFTSVSHEKMFGAEKALTRSLDRAQMETFGLPRGLYIEGYGAVFTAEIGLVYVPVVNPFRLTIPKEEIEAIHTRKVAQVPVLREIMTQFLLNAEASLDPIPPSEQVVLGITLLHEKWENSAGLPAQIIMQGQRSRLEEVRAGKVTPDAAIHVKVL